VQDKKGREMPEKLTLSAYLDQRGKKAKALKKGEAEAFGIPYPLQTGWPWRYGAMEITPAMIEDAKARIHKAKVEARNKAHCRPAAGEMGAVTQSVGAAVLTAPLFPGFALRRSKRHRPNKAAPRA
jgi:hypothetical protein